MQHRVGLLRIRQETANESNSDDRGIERDSGDPDHIVSRRSGDTRDRCSVGLANTLARRRIGVVVDIVKVYDRVDVGQKIRMAHLNAAVDDCDDDARSGIAVPDIRDVDVNSSNGVALSGIQKVPLIRE